MIPELKSAIESLYMVFSIYPLNSKIQSCPCCVSEDDKEKIHIKSLKDLDGEDLSRYSFKAMTTWGSVDDFRHFLPRIFELLATGNLVVSEFVILGKLEYGDWQSWPDNERAAIIGFLYGWWKNSLESKPYFEKEIFVEIYKLTKNMDRLLESWKVDFDNNSFKAYVDLIENYYSELATERSELRDVKGSDREKMKSWINTHAEKLEEGFFRFENTDKEFAEKISTALYIIETSRYSGIQ
ncbi:hypothetical protein HNP38_003027 [Chryseobacterium defluvii]|uniref:Uncharacterized protein n=1 Tax=Chryseobacterium defluvii TaxID=160396 RepID=A0A840KE89_9FLAO|nr:hypothetical protein [Chryseobacterium defluvii]MBB4807711.1 hypothetical protein [Chryseobacterium defluvii]